jgi:hypothetical protein
MKYVHTERAVSIAVVYFDETDSVVVRSAYEEAIHNSLRIGIKRLGSALVSSRQG